VAIASGYQHMLAPRADGSAWAWGWDANGQLGNGTIIDAPHLERFRADRSCPWPGRRRA
jgi:alpha-tubulin suppressor-like RCC1 family protein